MLSIYNLTITELLLIFSTTIFFVYVIQYHWKRRELYRRAAKINGPIAFPIIGSSYLTIGNLDGMIYTLCDLVSKYTGPVKFWIGNVLFFIIEDPESYKIIFNHADCLNKAEVYQYTELLVGHGLFSAPAEIWKKHRRSISPTFNQRLLNSYVPIFHKHAVNMEKALEKHLDKVFDVSHCIGEHTFNTVCETSMGVNADSMTKHKEVSSQLLKFMQYVYKRITNPFYQNDFIFFNLPVGRNMLKFVRLFNEVTGKLVAEKKLAMQNADKMNDHYIDDNSTKFKPFLELLLELVAKGEKFTDEQVKNEVATLLVAGVDTTATILSFALMMLGMYPDVQEKAYRESVEALTPDGSIDHTDLANLKYIERCVYETMRLYPIGPIIGRQFDENLEIGDKILPKGSNAILLSFYTHRSEKYWTDPLTFNPDRFLPEEVAKRHPYAYVPFAAGPRNCIGGKYGVMALKTYIAHLIRKFKISTPYKSVEEIRIMQAIIIKPLDGYKVRLTLRKE